MWKELGGWRGLGRWLQTEAGERCADFFLSFGIDRCDGRGWICEVILFFAGQERFPFIRKPTTCHGTTIDQTRSLRPVDSHD